ncbi:hypothetical protein [Escherichia coli]|uniref:hypothetical protein n=1 Tax=Escherichia coli TaxID=562 RepID=UPI00157ADF87|nr:hypothetical protein [Escherichia coli]
MRWRHQYFRWQLDLSALLATCGKGWCGVMKNTGECARALSGKMSCLRKNFAALPVLTLS